MCEQFTFAGFTFPRPLGSLPHATTGELVTGGYIVAPMPRVDKGAWSFYLDSDFMPDLRWKWCDDIVASIRHTGWYCDDMETTIRGLVMRLPHGRGFLVGWSMGLQMASMVDGHIYQDEQSAAHAADNMAEQAAVREREYHEANPEE